MNIQSLSQRVGFHISDLVNPKGRNVRSCVLDANWLMTRRLYLALQDEVRRSSARFTDVFLALQKDVILNYHHENGPVAQKLGFCLPDLVGQHQLYIRIRGDVNDYRMSARLYEAITREADGSMVLRASVFRALQDELLSDISADVTM